MVHPQKALKIILSFPGKYKTEIIRLNQAHNHILAQDVVARAHSPEFDKALMDGFAVHSGDTRKIPVTLDIVADIFAGRRSAKRIKNGQCARIATGAMLPSGADGVAMKEHARLLGDGRVMILKRILKDENVAWSGQDFKKGTRLLKKGAALNMSSVALLASLGVAFVRVFKKPTVAFFSTGDEIAEPGKKKKRRGHIWNASAPMLAYALKRLGIPCVYLGICPDDAERLKKKIKDGLKADILLITGAVSAGERDFVPMVLNKLGVTPLFHRVALKPGKPLFFGTKGEHAVFGLPGNPVSSMISFLLFVLPLIKKMSKTDPAWAIKKGVLTKSVYNETDRMSLFPARLAQRAGRFLVEPVAYSGSADLWAVSKADGFFFLEKNKKARNGDSVSVFPLSL